MLPLKRQKTEMKIHSHIEGFKGALILVHTRLFYLSRCVSSKIVVSIIFQVAYIFCCVIFNVHLTGLS